VDLVLKLGTDIHCGVEQIMDSKSSTPDLQSSIAQNVSLVITSCVIAALMAFLVVSKNFVFGSDPGNWTYPYFAAVAALPLWIPLLILVLLAISIFVGSRLILLHEKTTLWVCFLMAIFIELLIHASYPVPLGKIVQSDQANSFYSASLQYSPLEVLAHFSDLAPTLPLHARTNMPGKILLFQLLGIFTSSPEIMGVLVIILSTFGALLLYEICKQLFHDKIVAFYAFILYILIPGKLFFFPILNTISPLFILLCLYLFLLYLEKKKIIFLWLLGFVLYLQFLFEPSPLVTGIIFIGLLLNALGEKRISKKDIIAILLYPVLSFLVVYSIFYLIFSFDLLGAFRYVLSGAVNFNVIAGRSYKRWVVEDLKEFFYSVGTPVMVIFIYLVSLFFIQWRNIKSSVMHWTIENLFLFSLLVTFGFVVFSGINRGEISRLWIYLAVFFQVPTAHLIAKIPKSTMIFFFVALIVAMQSIIALQFVAFVKP
jgi:hypothetical protein